MQTKPRASWRFRLRRTIERWLQRRLGIDYYTTCRHCGRNAGLFTVYPDPAWEPTTGTPDPLCWGCFGKRYDQYACKKLGAEPAIVVVLPDGPARQQLVQWLQTLNDPDPPNTDPGSP